MLTKPLSRLFVLLAALCSASQVRADLGRVVVTPSWQYGFPPGLVDSADIVATSDLRYLAVATGRWSYHPLDKAEPVTVEGENAVYLFDLQQRRLLWKQVFAEGLAVSVVGVSDSAEYVAVKVGQSWPGSAQIVVRGQRGGVDVEGIRGLGVPEPGVRLYDRNGALVASRLPLTRTGRGQPYGTLALRAPREHEVTPSEETRQMLVLAGIGQASALPSHEPIARMSLDGGPCIVGLQPDGTVRWKWRVPQDEGLVSSRDEALVLSPDGRHGAASYSASAAERSPTRRFHLFSWEDGLQWSREFPREIPGHLGWKVSNQGRSVVIVREMSDRHVVDMLGPDGTTRGSLAFQGVGPAFDALSPTGIYWAASFARLAEGPSVDDMGWTEGLHVFDCATGEAVWQTPLMADATEIMVLDSGGVIAISEGSNALAVFDPPR